MNADMYKIPESNSIYIQQNLISEISKKQENQSFHIYFNQNLGYSRILNQNIFSLSPELGIELNHYVQASMFCKMIPQKFFINKNKTIQIKDFWSCGNAFAVIPFAASVVHPKIKLYGSMGKASGNKQNNLTISPVSMFFWSVKPELSLETNISENFKFNIGASYNFIFSNDSKELSENASGLEGILSISYNFL
jgi:hypothetical protein